MLGSIIAIIISFALLKIFKIDFSEFGFRPTSGRLKNFLIGFTVSAIVCSVYFLLIISTLEYDFRVNENFTLKKFLFGAWWTFRSVLMEELLFRGALLILAIKYMGKHKACFLSSIFFGIYHWFSYNVFGSLMPMLHTFLITFIGGLMFAYAFAETRSLYLPVALHFGWNLFTVTIFSEGPLGDQLLITSGGQPMGSLYFVFLLYQILVLPLLTYYYLKYSSKKVIVL